MKGSYTRVFYNNRRFFRRGCRRKESSGFFSRAQIEEVLSSMTGELQQVPPMYSAVKVKGKNYMNMQGKESK